MILKLLKYCRILLIISFLVISCSGPTNENDYQVGLFSQLPVVTGIIETNEVGEALGVWGYPNFPPNIDKKDNGIHTVLSMGNPFPNPTNGSVRIPFQCNRTDKPIKIWVAPARAIYQSDPQFKNHAQAIIINPLNRNERILLNQKVASGFAEIVWDGLNSYGKKVPDGFYRIYIEFDGNLLWRDIFMASSRNALPSGMRDFISEF